MKKHHGITQSLRRLDFLERELQRLPPESPERPAMSQEVASLRALIPTAILTHHDRMRARGKISVAPVRNGVCGGCHLAIPKGNLYRLRDPDELNVCDTCGAFIYLDAEEPEKPAAAAPAPAKRATRKKSAAA